MQVLKLALVLQAVHSVQQLGFVLHIWQRDPEKGFNKENYFQTHLCTLVVDVETTVFG